MARMAGFLVLECHTFSPYESSRLPCCKVAYKKNKLIPVKTHEMTYIANLHANCFRGCTQYFIGIIASCAKICASSRGPSSALVGQHVSSSRQVRANPPATSLHLSRLSGQVYPIPASQYTRCDVFFPPADPPTNRELGLSGGLF